VCELTHYKNRVHTIQNKERSRLFHYQDSTSEHKKAIAYITASHHPVLSQRRLITHPSQQDKIIYGSLNAFDLISSKTTNIIVTYTEFRKVPGQRQQRQRPKGKEQQQPSW
jgi:hypothetical protein